MFETLFSVLLLFVAMAYAMVGHGGASGYMALGIVFGMPVQDLRSQVLCLNLLVAGFSFIAFSRQGYFKANLLLPLVLVSMPAAFAGARLQVDPQVTQGLLGAALLFASLRMLIVSSSISKTRLLVPPLYVLLPTGVFLGFLAGMTGVGGGIYLSPVLLLLGWASIKQTAAVSAGFIWLNSAASLVGLASTEILRLPPLPWVVAAFVGGLVGAWAGSYQLAPKNLRRLLAITLLFAAFKLLWKTLL